METQKNFLNWSLPIPHSASVEGLFSLPQLVLRQEHQSFPLEGERWKDRDGGFNIADLFGKRNSKAPDFDKLNINK